MKTAFKYIGCILLLLIAAGAIIYNFFPGTMVSTMQSMGASSAGLSKKTADIDGYRAAYYEGGSENEQILVLLHGLGDDKNSFVGSVGELTNNYRVILPDLAAHGENAAEEGRDYSIRGQVEFVAKLMDKVGAETVHIGGNSMGGHVAAAFAARYPDKARSLIVINATGMQLKDESVYLYYPEVVDRAFIDDMFSRVFANEPSIPDVIIDHMITELNPKIPFMNALVAEVEKGPDFRLNEQMTNVTILAYVLWGKEDPVVPVAYAEAFHAALPNSKIKLLENAGHSPQFEIADIVQSEIAAFLKTVPASSKKKSSELSADEIRLQAGFTEHAALTQLHRWYQLYENPSVSVENTLDILTPDIAIKSASGQVSGHNEYKAYLAQIPKGMKNAHFVRNAKISKNDDSSISMSVDIIYENAGLNDDGSIKQADIAYATTLVASDGILPKFSKMEISQTKDGSTATFRPAYGENRMLSLVHYWLTILDNPAKDPAPAHEIFADGFSLNFSTGAVTDFAAFQKWYLERAAPVVANTHKLSNFSYMKSNAGVYQVTVDFAREGLLKGGQLMGAKTRHKWTVEDDPADRFAKIKSMDVELLEPFAPKKS